MTALLDGRPPGVDAWFRPGKTFSFTMPWEAGALDGRTFTATLDTEDLAVTVAGDSLIFEATAAQTTTLGVGGHDFTLTETTGGGSEPVVIGNWAGSTHAAIAAVSDTLTVAETAGTVEVSLVDGTANAVKLTGDQTKAGVLEFLTSPLVPNPAAGITSAVSLGEAQDVASTAVGELPTLEDGNRTTVENTVTGQVSVDLAASVAELRVPTLPFAQVSNRTDEVTISTLSFEAGELADGSLLNWHIAADLTNNSGAAATTTIRVKCDGATVWTITLAAVASAASARKMFADLPANVATFSGLRVFGRGRWALTDAGADTVATDAVVAASTAAIIPTTAHDWTVTAQHSVASASLTLQTFGIQAGYRP